MHLTIHSLIREASMHPKKSKQMGITADIVREVTEVGVIECGFDVI